jgi:asparagine synthase (glutamine-hydrolysing)
MCGILGVIGNVSQEELERCLEALKARGPELQTLTNPLPSVSLGFTRLAINGLTAAGNQPINAGSWVAVCNGEIYNYRELAATYELNMPEGASDCWVIPHLLEKLGDATQVCRALDGVFAFIAVNTESGEVLVARDPYGVRPLFQVNVGAKAAWASELKGLPALPALPALPELPTPPTNLAPFPPGTWRIFTSDGIQYKEEKYHTIPWIKQPHANMTNLRTALEAAVEKRLLSERPVGALLSGGLDSSLVAAIAARKLAERGQKLHTFSIGMSGSTDLGYARMVAEWIGSEHHEILCSKDDFLGAVSTVVGTIESYDITTVRASVGNWLVGKWIRENTDIKVVLNGDGSDEVGGGYLYFYKAPNDAAFEAESERLLKDIHIYDVLRSDRCISAHGLEPRTPFLDKQFVAVWRGLPTEWRRPSAARMEKWVLREAFNGTGLLPDAVLWRKKEAFSDGVSSTEESWYQTVSHWCEEKGVGIEGWTHNPPRTAEGAWYRQLFEARYDAAAAACIPYMWMPRWISGVTDPSARVLKELYTTNK